MIIYISKSCFCICVVSEYHNVMNPKVLPCNFITMHEISGIRRRLFNKNCYYKIYRAHQSYHPKRIFMEMISFNSLLSKVSGELPV